MRGSARNRPFCNLFLTVLLFGLVFVPACSEESTGPDDNDSTPPDLSTPDLLMTAFEQAMEDMDAELYADLLYDGSDIGRAAFAPFAFYFPEGSDFYGNALPGQWARSDERECMAVLLGGESGILIDGDPVPGIASIEVDLTPVGDWGPAVGPDAYGDAYPQGTLRRVYMDSGTIMLKGTMPDYDATGFMMEDESDFFIIPVSIDSDDGVRTEYRLWKWKNRSDWRGAPRQAPMRTEHAAWGWIKPLYHDLQGLYLPYTSPDGLIENFRRAWERMDGAEYRDRILYDGVQHAPDDNAYASFVFYFAEGNDFWGEPLPTLQSHEEEVANVLRMFSGNPGVGPGGQEVPGVASISLNLAQNLAWMAPPQPQVLGDPYPAGTQWAAFAADLFVALKGTMPGGDITGFTVDDDQLAYIVPVLVNEGDGSAHVEYRLWKWLDLGMNGLRTEEGNWSVIKALY